MKTISCTLFILSVLVALTTRIFSVSYIGDEMSIDSGQFVYQRSGSKVGLGTSNPINNFTVSGDVRVRGIAMMAERAHSSVATGIDWRFGNKLVVDVPFNSNSPTLTLAFSNNPPGPALLSLRVFMNNDGLVRNLVITGASVRWPLGTPPVLSGYNAVIYFYFDGTQYFGIRSFNR